MRKHLSLLVLAALMVGLVGCDHVTKHLAVTRLEARAPVPVVPGFLDLAYTENRDVSFGLLRLVPEPARFPLILGLELLLGLGVAGFWVVRRRRGEASGLEQLACALVLAGDAGNLLDRITVGHVVDFIHLHHWPVFNVADICIVGGVALFLWSQRRLAPRRATRSGAG